MSTVMPCNHWQETQIELKQVCLKFRAIFSVSLCIESFISDQNQSKDRTLHRDKSPWPDLAPAFNLVASPLIYLLRSGIRFFLRNLISLPFQPLCLTQSDQTTGLVLPALSSGAHSTACTISCLQTTGQAIFSFRPEHVQCRWMHQRSNQEKGAWADTKEEGGLLP